MILVVGVVEILLEGVNIVLVKELGVDLSYVEVYDVLVVVNLIEFLVMDIDVKVVLEVNIVDGKIVGFVLNVMDDFDICFVVYDVLV